MSAATASSFPMRPYQPYQSEIKRPASSLSSASSNSTTCPPSSRSSMHSNRSYGGHYDRGDGEGAYYFGSRPATRIEDRASWEVITKLMDAASSNQINVVSNLIRSGAVSPDAQDSKENTALLYASINGHMHVVRKLIELGATVNYPHPYTLNTALHLAAQCGHTRTVELLLKSGAANARSSNREGKTAYQLAKDFGHGNNKVMKRLFQEYGGIMTSGGSGKGGHRRRNGGHVSDSDDSDDDDEAMQDSAGSKGRGSSPDDADGSRAAPDDKIHSLIPNFELLAILAINGIYRPLASGKGFAFLTPHTELSKMIEYARIALQISAGDYAELQEQLRAIQREFEEDLLLQNQTIYRKVMNVDEQTGSLPRSKSSSSSSSLHSQKRSKRGGSTEQFSDRSVVLDAESELHNYQKWKQCNMSKIQEMINAIDGVASPNSSSTSE